MTFTQIWFIITSIITITLLTVSIIIGVRDHKWWRRYREFMQKFGLQNSWELEEIKRHYGVKTFDELSEIVEKRGIQTLAELDEIMYYANTHQWNLYDRAILNWLNNSKKDSATVDEGDGVEAENTKEKRESDVDKPASA